MHWTGNLLMLAIFAVPLFAFALYPADKYIYQRNLGKFARLPRCVRRKNTCAAINRAGRDSISIIPLNFSVI